MQGQGQGNASNNSLINPDEQRQNGSFREGLNQGSPSSIVSQIMQSGNSDEYDQMRAVARLVSRLDIEIFSRGIQLQRMNHQSGPGPQMVQQGNVSSALTSNIDLNANDPNQAGPTLNPITPSGPEAPRAEAGNPILISSEANGLEEDDDGGQGTSSNGRRPSLKRRATEDPPRQHLLGESSGSVGQQEVVAAHGTDALNNGANYVNHFGQLEAGNGIGMGAAFPATHEPQNVAGGVTVLEAGVGGGPTVNQHLTGAASLMVNQASIRARQSEIFQRNIRLRRNPNPQDFTPASQLTQNPMNSHVQSPSQTAMLFSYDQLVNSRAQPVHLTPVRQYVQVPEPFLTQRVPVQVPGQGITISAAGGAPSSSEQTQLEEGNLGNNQRNIMFPGFERGNLSHMAENMNLAHGNTNSPGNAAASFQDPSDSIPRISAVPIWYQDQAISYSNRILEIISRIENRGLQGDYRPAHTGSGAPTGDVENSIRSGSMRPRLGPRRAGRQDAENPDILRRRQHMVSEVQNALALVRGGGGLRFGDIRVISRSVLLRMLEEEIVGDGHEDMRLDIDNMSYEELIDVGVEIGNVSTGLREETILANLMVQRHKSLEAGPPDDDDGGPICCICQDAYADGENVGKLACGHDFHAECIKLWLMRKNQCPICKRIGLAEGKGVGKH